MKSMSLNFEAYIDGLVQDKVTAAMAIMKVQLKKELAEGENIKLKGIKELAAFLRISYPKARELAVKKDFPRLPTGSKIPLFMSVDVMDYMHSHSEGYQK